MRQQSRRGDLRQRAINPGHIPSKVSPETTLRTSAYVRARSIAEEAHPVGGGGERG